MSKRTRVPYDREMIAGRLRQIRDERGLTQRRMAEMIGVTQGALSNYESSKRDLPLRTLLRMCAVLRLAPGKVVPSLDGD